MANNPLLQYFSDIAKRVEYVKKHQLLMAGQICNKAYFIESGVIRSWYNKDGEDISFQFFLSGDAVSSFESLKNGEPCIFNIETLTPCVLYEVNRNDLFATVDNNPQLKEYIHELILKRFYHYQKLFLSRIINSPKERYIELQQQNPELFKQIPQHYIASYLGITSVSLSRIVSNLKKQ